MCNSHTLVELFSSRTVSRILARACALSLAALVARPAGAIDGTATVTGGEVQFYGVAETNWLNGTELLLKFEGEGSFILPGLSKARILAVGGGGGGGGIFPYGEIGMSGVFGAGAGGGAGGFVEMTNVFSAATYSVTVGSGGPGGASSLERFGLLYTGSSGGSTQVSTNGIAFVAAEGGGGGGGEHAGLSGGSGGGGSQYTEDAVVGQPQAGGSVTGNGLGFPGGAGDTGC
jgi:hypothetical protein